MMLPRAKPVKHNIITQENMLQQAALRSLPNAAIQANVNKEYDIARRLCLHNN
ncbi:MAG: hypothetical protein ABR497_12470 [Kiritimatiellia bacterium]|nr:hypothetical protein [Lentisphaerota bacterium]